MSLKSISDNIVTLASGITNTATFDGFASIFDYVPDVPSIIANGSPILIILPTGIDSPISTTQENERVYSFLLDVYVADDNNISKSAIENQLKYSVDALLNAIDKNYHTIGDWIDTNITNWDYNFQNGYRRATITAQVHLLTNIT